MNTLLQLRRYTYPPQPNMHKTILHVPASNLTSLHSQIGFTLFQMTWDSVDRWLHLWPTMFSLYPPMESGRCSWNELRDKTLPTWYSKCSLEILNLWKTTLNHPSTGKGVSLLDSFSPSLYILQKSRGQPPQAYSQRHMVQLGFITLKSHLKKSKENWQSSQTLILMWECHISIFWFHWLNKLPWLRLVRT